ncbi:ATP-binding protein, partial [Vibrio anguillarum]|nr:ATP-binding protein [Vibrio anguillarum]
MISRIEAYKYRCFNTLDLALEQQHVFAGSNGSGKTTLLDIPALFGD